MTIILTLKVKSRKDPNEDRRSESLPISILLMSNFPLGRVTGFVRSVRDIFHLKMSIASNAMAVCQRMEDSTFIVICVANVSNQALSTVKHVVGVTQKDIAVRDRLTQVLVTCVENWDTREGTVQRASQSHQERGQKRKSQINLQKLLPVRKNTRRNFQGKQRRKRLSEKAQSHGGVDVRANLTVLIYVNRRAFPEIWRKHCLKSNYPVKLGETSAG